MEDSFGHYISNDNVNDTQRRMKIISMFVDLMVYDVKGDHGGSDEIDFEECLAQFMLEEYFVEGDDVSIEQIAKIMMKVRKELIKTAIDSQQLWSYELEKLRMFDQVMKSKQEEMKKHYKGLKKADESSDDGDEFWDDSDSDG